MIIIDEPHNFEGKQTAKYLKKFNALFTLRFGVTFKNDEYKNLIYTLDSFEELSKKEQLQIKSAEKFFKRLKEKGVNIEYKTKLNSPKLSQLIGDVLEKFK